MNKGGRRREAERMEGSGEDAAEGRKGKGRKRAEGQGRVKKARGGAMHMHLDGDTGRLWRRRSVVSTAVGRETRRCRSARGFLSNRLRVTEYPVPWVGLEAAPAEKRLRAA